MRRELRRRADLALGAAERPRPRPIDSLGWRFIALSIGATPRSTASTPASSPAPSAFARAAGASRRGVETVDYEDLSARLKKPKQRLTSGVVAPVPRLIDGDPSDAAGILRQLPERSTLVEYFSLGDELIALVGSAERVEAVTLPVSSRDIALLVAGYLRGGAGDADLASRLYSALVAPLEDRIHGERLVIVPFGSLYELPFETLRDSRGYLLSRWDVLYLPAASVLKHLRRSKENEPPPRLLAVVDPDTDYNHDGKPDMPSLPYARDEVNGFASSFEQRSVLVGPAALEARSASATPGRSTIHYACHGEFYPARP